MENSLKGLILAAGVVVTCIVVSMGFYMAREAKNATNNGISQISEITSMNDVAKEMYDGLSISGREVVNILSKYTKNLNDGELVVSVTTGKGTSAVTTNYQAAYTDSNNPTVYTNTAYINPNGVFRASVDHNEKGIITMTFVQES